MENRYLAILHENISLSVLWYARTILADLYD